MTTIHFHAPHQKVIPSWTQLPAFPAVNSSFFVNSVQYLGSLIHPTPASHTVQMAAVLQDPNTIITETRSADSKHRLPQNNANVTLNIKQRLGSGAFGQVFRAEALYRDQSLPVVVKKIQAKPHTEAYDRAKQEAKLMMELGNQDLSFPRVYDFISSGSQHYLLMRYRQSIDGKALLKSKNPLSPKAIISLGFRAAGALKELHDRGIVHRDIKPGNILISTEPESLGQVQLIDFGISKDKSSSSIQTTHGVALGTPRYMYFRSITPNEHEEYADKSEFSDVYALAVTLLEFLLNEPLKSLENTTRTGSPILPCREMYVSELEKLLEKLELKLSSSPETSFDFTHRLLQLMRRALTLDRPIESNQEPSYSIEQMQNDLRQIFRQSIGTSLKESLQKISKKKPQLETTESFFPIPLNVPVTSPLLDAIHRQKLASLPTMLAGSITNAPKNQHSATFLAMIGLSLGLVPTVLIGLPLVGFLAYLKWEAEHQTVNNHSGLNIAEPAIENATPKKTAPAKLKEEVLDNLEEKPPSPLAVTIPVPSIQVQQLTIDPIASSPIEKSPPLEPDVVQNFVPTATQSQPAPKFAIQNSLVEKLQTIDDLPKNFQIRIQGNQTLSTNVENKRKHISFSQDIQLPEGVYLMVLSSEKKDTKFFFTMTVLDNGQIEFGNTQSNTDKKRK